MTTQTPFKDYVLAFLFSAMLFGCMVYFIVGLAGEYGFSAEYVSNPNMNVSEFRTQLDSTYNDSDAWKTSTTDDDMATDVGVNFFTSFWGTVTRIFNTLTTYVNLLLFGIAKTILPPQLMWVYYSFLTMFTIAVIFMIWRVIKTGE